MLTRRIIPCLDVDAGRVVKGTSFVNLRDAGDPAELASRYDQEGADELVFLDITASSDSRDTMVDVVRAVSEQVFIPLTVGGGIRSIEDVRRMLNAGADKVSVNTAAINTPELVAQGSAQFGSQCIVTAIDARRVVPGEPYPEPRDETLALDDMSGWQVYTHGGRNPTGLDAVKWAERTVALGSGEILLTSMDEDGQQDGYDLPAHPRHLTCRSRPGHRQRRRRQTRPSLRCLHRRRGRRGAGGQHLPFRYLLHRPGQGFPRRAWHPHAGLNPNNPPTAIPSFAIVLTSNRHSGESRNPELPRKSAPSKTPATLC